MAPRRGGGGGGGGSVENQCSRNGAFRSEYDIAQIALLGAFLLFFTVLWCVACSTTGKKKQAGTFRILRWYQWGIAIFLAFLWFSLSIVRHVLSQCYIISPYGAEYTGIGVATTIAMALSELWMMALVLFVVIGRLFELAGSKAIKRTFGVIYTAQFSILFILNAVTVIMGIVLVFQDTSRGVLIAFYRLSQAYVVFLLLTSISASVGLCLAWIRVARTPGAKQGVTGWIPVLILCLLGYSLYQVIYLFLIYYGHEPTMIGILVGVGLGYLFFFGVYLSIYMISRGKGWDYMGHNGTRDSGAAFVMGGAQQQNTGYQGAYDPHNAPVPVAGKDRPGSTTYASRTSVQGTPAPPYAAYSGNGNYAEMPAGQGQLYNPGGWNTGGYAPVQNR